MPEESTRNTSELTEGAAVTPAHASSSVPAPAAIDDTDISYGAEEPPEDFFIAEEYGESFSALSKSIQEAHDLKKKRRALDEYNKTLNTLKLAHADRVDIAKNYDSLVAEQERIKRGCLASVDDCNVRSQEIDAKISKASGALEELKQSQEEATKPLEDELNRCEAMLRSAKEEYKQVRSQRESLDLFDNSQEGASLDAGAHDQIVSDIEAKYASAKEARRVAQKDLDAQVKSNKADQKRIHDYIKKLNGEKSKIAKEVADLQQKASAADERIAFCGFVIEHPEQTQAMRERIIENEKTAARMEEQINQLADEHGVSVKASSKARTVVIIAIAAVVIVAALFIFLSNR